MEALTDELVEFSAAVALEPTGHLAVQLSVEARTHRAAFERGDRAVATAAATCGLADAEVVEVQVLTDREFERRLAEPTVPPLYGITEAAEFLHVSTQRADELFRKHPDRLPTLTKFAGARGARVWLASTWHRFEATWDRANPGGRPKATTNEPPAA